MYARRPGEFRDESPSRFLDNIASMDIVTAMPTNDERLRAEKAERAEKTESVDELLPLPPATFHILMALAEEDRHGYAILQDVERRTQGEVRLSAGTLYRSIQRMLEQGLLVETQERPAPEEDDERRRYYRITPFGEAVARAETRRLTELVRLARASGFVPRSA